MCLGLVPMTKNIKKTPKVFDSTGNMVKLSALSLLSHGVMDIELSFKVSGPGSKPARNFSPLEYKAVGKMKGHLYLGARLGLSSQVKDQFN